MQQRNFDPSGRLAARKRLDTIGRDMSICWWEYQNAKRDNSPLKIRLKAKLEELRVEYFHLFPVFTALQEAWYAKDPLNRNRFTKVEFSEDRKI